jgi:hypothetical protein
VLSGQAVRAADDLAIDDLDVAAELLGQVRSPADYENSHRETVRQVA